jgi:CarD family transcriptional regulator
VSAFKVGEKVVYPNHGVTVIENIAESDINGSKHTFIHLRLLANDSKLMVPVDNTNRIGLRRLYKRNEIKDLIGLLEDEVGPKVSDWKDRYRENLEKMKTGKLEDVAHVLKNLNQVSKRKSLSFREKKMYDRAKHLLVSEIAIVKGISEIEAAGVIEKSLEKSLTVVNH